MNFTNKFNQDIEDSWIKESAYRAFAQEFEQSPPILDDDDDFFHLDYQDNSVVLDKFNLLARRG